MAKIPQTLFGAGEFSPELQDRIDLAKYRAGLKTSLNGFPLAQGGWVNRAGLSFVAETKQPTIRSRLMPWEFSPSNTYVMEWGGAYFRLCQNGARVVYPVGHGSAGQPVDITTSYTIEQARALRAAQSADVMYLVEETSTVRKLSRSDHHLWTFEDLDFAPPIAQPANISASKNYPETGNSTAYTVTAVNVDGEESYQGTASTVSGRNIEDLTDSQFNQITWSSVGGAVHYNVYRQRNGIYSFAGQATSTTFNDTGYAIDPDVSPPIPRDPFPGAAYPRCVTFYQDRLTFGVDIRLEMSRSGAYENMTESSPNQADDSLSFTPLSRKVGLINHIVPKKRLLIFTEVSEGSIAAFSSDEAISPTSVDYDKDTENGSLFAAEPLEIGREVLYVQQKGGRVLRHTYDIQADGFSGADLTLFARHIFQGRTIVAWAYQKEPWGVCWVVFADGKAASLTYLPEQDVVAWSRHETDGLFEDVVVVSEGTEDVPYFQVQRTINGATKRYIERMETRTDQAIEDGFFVDSGVRYSGSAISTVTGADHLEGEQVAVLGDGDYLGLHTVSGGQFTLAHACSKIIYGLPYVSDLETLKIDSVQRPLSGAPRSVKSVTVKVKNTTGIQAGQAFTNLNLVPLRTTEAIGDPTQPTSGEIAVDLPAGWTDEGRVCLRQDKPLPMHITGLVPDVVAGR